MFAYASWRAAAVTALIGAPMAAQAQTATLQEICQNCYVTSLSADGGSATGMMADNGETFLWRAGGKATRLGRSTADTLGVTGGQPAISSDGTRIASTILSNDGTLATSGYWQQGHWKQITPPLPPDAGAGDSQDSSVWAMSGNGKTIVGLYWRYGQPSGGTANGMVWTAKTHMVGLPTAGGDSRVNAASQDGHVLGGWESDATAGNWRAAVWVDGVKTIIGSDANWSMVQATNPDGTILAGQEFDAKSQLSAAAIWTWRSGSWRLRTLGVLDGTDPVFGYSLANAVSYNGKIAVGLNVVDFGGGSLGIVWTPKGKLQAANDYFAQFGYSNPGFTITDVLAMTRDGRHFGIIETSDAPPLRQRSAELTIN